MDEIKIIPVQEFKIINVEYPFNQSLLVKDYYLTLLLFLIKDVNGIYFKGGTALNKIFLKHARLSEDLDFTLTKDEKEVKKEIVELVNNSNLFNNIKDGKSVDGYIRLIVGYSSELGNGEIFIDLNKRGKLIMPSEVYDIEHFYHPFVPKFLVKTVAKEELIAEKVAAAIGRNKPRDNFDIYMIIKGKLPLNMKLVEKKCLESGNEFSIIKMFNKAQTLKNRWDSDMKVLIAEDISFSEVIKALAKHFNLKREKIKKDKV